MSRPRFDELNVTRWLSLYGEMLPHDEERVRLAIEFYYSATQPEPTDFSAGPLTNLLVDPRIDFYRNVRFTDLLRTSGVFVIDPYDVIRPTADELAQPRPLPPMPFKRMFFEFWDSRADRSVPLSKFMDLDNTLAYLYGVGIVEVKQSVEWRVYMLMPSTFAEFDYAIREYTLVYDEETETTRFGTNIYEFEQSGLDEEQITIWKLLAHETPRLLVETSSILGAKHDAVAVPRQHRRRVERSQRFAFPSVYHVDLRGAGESDSEPGDHAKREYGVRWIVRGHYRREDNGQYDVPGKGSCTWVRAHVKGPPGMPWKGRPIYDG